MSTWFPPSNGDKPPLALIAGPTASGKSALAMDLAERLAAKGHRPVIVNADSMQIYRDIPILSAAPSAAEMRIWPHRLYLEWDADEACSAADWATRAKIEITQLHADGATPIVVGGTGLYIQTLLEGIAPIPTIDSQVRASVRALDSEDSYTMLSQEDPKAAQKLNPRDKQRIARALEVVRSTGQPLSHWQARKTGGIGAQVALYPLIVNPARAWLYARCDQRFAEMLDHGAVEETRRLIARHLDPSLPALRAIGLREISAWLEGQVSRAEAIETGQQATRNYAKRQYTWFKGQIPQDWARVNTQTDNIDEYFEIIFRDC